MEKAKEEIGAAHGAKLEKLKEKMKQLEDKLKEAQENKERALSRAQMTKSGHVYIISNIGSFGEDVFKIGMTRRLEPTEQFLNRSILDSYLHYSTKPDDLLLASTSSLLL